MISPSLIEDILTVALETGGDFAEVFIEDRKKTQIQSVGVRVDSALAGWDHGIGIRVLSDSFFVYGYTNDFTRDNLLKVARSIAQAIQGKVSQNRVLDLRKSLVHDLHPIQIYPQEYQKKTKVEWVRRASEAAISYDPLISQVRTQYSDYDQKILIANSEGLYKEDRRVRCRMVIEAIATSGLNKQTGHIGTGTGAGLEYFEQFDLEGAGREAARMAKTMVLAENAPTGKMPVVIDNAYGGVIFHEACGHGLEATQVAKKASVYTDKLGEHVASPLVTAVDDGTVTNGWGSLNIDDEGENTRQNVLIENGVLKGYLIDRLGARSMGMNSTGSARRENYKYAPTSRMTNTYIAAGTSTPEEIIANTEFGLYAKHVGGGSVNTASGDFNFAVREAYMIRNGKIAEPVRGAALVGKGMEVLKSIDMVGNNLSTGEGMCGSVSGSIPASVGQPMIRVSELTVGGRKGK